MTYDASLSTAFRAITYEDPTRMVQRAWSTIRLHQLQRLVAVAIDELYQVTPAVLMGREVAPAIGVADPLHAALEACCAELRDACGMAGARTERQRQYGVIRSLYDAQPLAWASLFAEALDNYRCIASKTLHSSFAAQTAP